MEVSALISIDNEATERLMADCDIELEEDKLVLIKRTFNTAGKSSCRINGKSVTVGMLKRAGACLVDIHGQHDHQSLINPSSHIVMLDRLCERALTEPKAELAKVYDEYSKVCRELRGIDTNEADIQDKIEFYKYQINEIEAASLTLGEDEELNEKRVLLSNSVKLINCADRALEALYRSSEANASELIGEAHNALTELAQIDKSCESIAEELYNAYAVIEDVTSELRNYADNVECDPQQLNDIEERLQLIYELKKKYGGSIESILKHLDTISDKLEYIENSEERSKELSEAKTRLTDRIKALCSEISDIRLKCASEASGRIADVLRELGMENVHFEIKVERKEGFDKNGYDSVEFMISPNSGEELKPLSRIASGGEMSRVMLALKTILAEVDNIGTFIFDEIDTGISGRTAQKVAEKLHIVSKLHQIICITHLPQLAAMADNHYVIEKISEENMTKTVVLELPENKVYNELARLIGGAEITEATLEAAREMKKMSNKLKENKL
jgi:DNA repair protein RecN (Recombination protein N)